MSYIRFFAMIATSTLIMFGLMYLNTYAWEHVFYSETRAYMALVMGATMAIVMLAFMLSMYKNRIANIAIFIIAAATFTGSLYLVRSQATVQQESYMKAMIPHHSIAIMTSERATLTDPRVRELAMSIIEAQRREIAEMRYLVAEHSGEGSPDRQGVAWPPPRAKTATVAEALTTADRFSIEPSTMTPEEFEAALDGDNECRFQMTRSGRPVLAVSQDRGAVKINGKLVRLPQVGAGQFASGPVRVKVAVNAEEADLEFSLDGGRTVGYRGVYLCD